MVDFKDRLEYFLTFLYEVAEDGFVAEGSSY